ncbi:MAG: protoheme IX farnesyltransferase [Phycisphaerae bacterium]|nr:protoheme IX farnesyltransferase [Phycisphaerae bacterium]
MTTTPATTVSEPADSGSGASVTDRPDTLLRSIIDLSKVRIAWLVTLTSGVGFLLAALGRPWRPTELALAALGTVVGTALSAMGANALNQWWERERDALMHRTRARPIPSGRMAPGAAFLAAIALAAVGLAVLWLASGPLPMLISFTTILIYVLVYTPLKPLTTLNTIIGAVPGALPPLIGWAAASPAPASLAIDPAPLLQPGGWSLFLLMFVWQIPHFLAIATMYHEDYARGGYRMLPADDPGDERTARVIVLWTIALVPVGLAPAWLIPGRLGPGFMVVAALIGLLFLAAAARHFHVRARQTARAVFFASIMHLPIYLLAIVGDAMLVAFL